MKKRNIETNGAIDTLCSSRFCAEMPHFVHRTRVLVSERMGSHTQNEHTNNKTTNSSLILPPDSGTLPDHPIGDAVAKVGSHRLATR